MFTWSDTCDTAIMERGSMVAMTDAKKETINSIVETVSNKIGKKLDWHYAAGRGIIKALPEDFQSASDALREVYPDGKLPEFWQPVEGVHHHYSIVIY